MPALYPEPNPQDEFTLADWREAVATAKPGGADSYSRRSGTASLVVHVAANKVRSFRAFVTGHSRGDATTFKLFRANPPRHPEFPEMRAVRVAVNRLSPKARAATDPITVQPIQVVWRYSDDPEAEVPRFTAYEQAECTVTFELLPYEMATDDDPRFLSAGGQEYRRNTALFESTDPKLEIMMSERADAGTWLKWAESAGGPPNGPNVGAGFGGFVGQFQIMTDFVLAWFGVEHTFLFDNYAPKKLVAGLGSVNKDDWNGFPAGTLRIDGVRLQKYRLPIWVRQSNVGVLPVFEHDVFLMLKHFDPPLGATNPITRGFNTFCWANSGKYFCAKRGNGSFYLPEATFDNVFTHVLDAATPVRV